MTGTVVITGGKGFVGQHLVRELEQVWSQIQIVIWDLPEIDITKPETYVAQLEELQPTWLVHLAALAGVRQSFDEPERYRAVNIEGTRLLLEAVEQHSAQTRLVVASSADIYGGAAKAGLAIPELPLAECIPRSPYAESKLAMEQLIESSFSDRCIRVRPFAHIGPKQQRGFVTSDFASQIAAIECGEQKPVLAVGNLEAKRDFTDVRDVVRAYRLLMEQGALGQVYNVASGVAISVKDILNRLLALSPTTITVEKDPRKMRPSDVLELIGDAQALRAATAWSPQIPLEQSLADILNYWRAVVDDKR